MSDPAKALSAPAPDATVPAQAVQPIPGQTAPQWATVAPTAASAHEADPIDEAVLGALVDQLGAEAVAYLVEVLAEDGALRVTDLQDQARRGDWVAVSTQAHALKSSTGTFGLRGLRSGAEQIEHACRDGHGPHAAEAIGRLVASFSPAIEALRQRVRRP